MQVVVIDMTAPLRAALVGRLQEAARQAGLSRVAVVEVDPINLDGVAWEKTIGCVIGPGCGSMIRELISKIDETPLRGRMCLALEREVYVSEAVAVYRLLGKPIVCETDLTQFATFLIDCDAIAAGRTGGLKRSRVIGLAQFKGGVGCSTLAAALAQVYSERGETTVLLDLDEVSCTLTEWGKASRAHRQAVSDGIRRGNLTPERIREMLVQIEGLNERTSLLPQPLSYYEGFHLKGQVIDSAPPPSEYIGALLGLLTAQFENIVIDLSHSWGVANFAALPWCERVLMVVDDDALTVRRAIDSLRRFRDESGDAEEFNLQKWEVVCNRASGNRLARAEIRHAMEQSGLWIGIPPVHTVGVSEAGRTWAVPGQTFATTCGRSVRRQIESLATVSAPSTERHTRVVVDRSGATWWSRISGG
jgi:cellulose biosynthesis protein BcsQ